MITDNSTSKCGSDGGVDVITQVKAQVMTRDDSSGGWVPVSGGGLSIVALVSRHLCTEVVEAVDAYSPAGVEFVIQGHRVSDHEVILNCTLMMDLQYVMVNPTFHHWQTGNKRYGLTFQNSSDAHIFEQSIRAVAYETVREYRKHVQANVRHQHQSQQSQLRMISTDRDISMMLRGHQNHQSSCELDEGTSLLTSPAAHSFYSPDKCETAELEYEINGGDEDLAKDFNQEMQLFKDSTKIQLPDDILSIDSSYVRFATKADSAVHDYCYPTMKSRFRRESSRRQQARAKRMQSANLNSPYVKGEGHLRCVYCGELFSSIEKKQTMCVDAPDSLRNCIDVVTCACMADSIAYHCFADEEGDYEPMCSCTPSQNSTARWALVVFLSFVLPCLCCFWPLMGCRRCLRACGCCRTSHRAV